MQRQEGTYHRWSWRLTRWSCRSLRMSLRLSLCSLSLKVRGRVRTRVRTILMDSTTLSSRFSSLNFQSLSAYAQPATSTQISSNELSECSQLSPITSRHHLTQPL